VEQRLDELRAKYGEFGGFESGLPDDFSSHEVWFEWRSLIRMREAIIEELKDIDKAAREIIMGV